MILSAAPINATAVLPDELVDQMVKPGGDQAVLLDALRLTALDWVERHTGCSLMSRSWTARCTGFDDLKRLPREPVQAVTSVTYVDRSGLSVDAAGSWQLSGSVLSPVADTRWPKTNGAVTVSFVAGYADVASEAPALRIAALLLIKHLFDGGSLADVPATVTMLVDEPFRTPVMA